MNLYDTLERLDLKQLREVGGFVAGRLSQLAHGTPPPAAKSFIPVLKAYVPIAPYLPTATPDRTTFRPGDIVEFHSEKHGRKIKLHVARVNAKSLGGHEVGNAHSKWRVSPGLCTRVAPLPVPAMAAPASSTGAVPTAPGAGRW